MSNGLTNKIVAGVCVSLLVTVILCILSFYGDAKAQEVTIQRHGLDISELQQGFKDVSKSVVAIDRNIAEQTVTLKSIDKRMERLENK